MEKARKVSITVENTFDSYNETKTLELNDGDDNRDGFIAEIMLLFPKYDDALSKNKYKLMTDGAVIKTEQEFTEIIQELFADDDESLDFKIIIQSEQNNDSKTDLIVDNSIPGATEPGTQPGSQNNDSRNNKYDGDRRKRGKRGGKKYYNKNRNNSYYNVCCYIIFEIYGYQYI